VRNLVANQIEHKNKKSGVEYFVSIPSLMYQSVSCVASIPILILGLLSEKEII
jgi:hypothetical protein